MKRIVTILVFCLLSFSAAVFNPLFAQLVQPVKWSGEEVGDSVRLRAVVEPGWHMSILEMGEFMFPQEFQDSFSMTVAKTDLAPIRFNACNDVMCTAPEIWEYEGASPQSSPEGKDLQNTPPFREGQGVGPLSGLLFRSINPSPVCAHFSTTYGR